MRLYIAAAALLVLFSFTAGAVAAPTDEVSAQADAADEALVIDKKEIIPAAGAPIDWVAVESTGTIVDVKSGALERTLWAGQKRSDIEALIKELPEQQKLRSMLNLQRRLLLSKTDAGLIVNDTKPEPGKDLLIARINKLANMGLFDDAWALYTQKSEAPYDVSIAKLGMLMMILRNDLPTACLEEKVFAARYPADDFFKNLDAACNDILGASVPEFKNSPVLQSIYHDENYSIGAVRYDVIARMSRLERALVLANGKIRYDGLTPEILRETPSSILALYLMDGEIPESAHAMAKREADARGLSWHIASIARDPDWQKARNVGKDLDAQWPLVESALNRIGNPADLAAYTGMIEVAEPKNLSTDVLIKAMGALLACARPLPEFWLKAAHKAAAEKPIIYIYLKLFSELTPSPKVVVTSENLKEGFQAIKPADASQIVGIVTTLDKTEDILNIANKAYDKESALTLENNYVMHSGELNELVKTALKQKHIGITVLATLNGLAATPDNMYSDAVRKSLESMLHMGLIEDAKLVGAETAARVLNKY